MFIANPSSGTLTFTIASPVGPLTIVIADDVITTLHIGRTASAGRSPPAGTMTPLARESKRQLDAYFARQLTAFDLPVEPMGTEFQRRLWQALERIPYGEVRTYGELARETASVARAVGAACGSNPIPIIIPCHRVVGGTSLGGYSGGAGLATKKVLLALERRDLFSRLP